MLALSMAGVFSSQVSSDQAESPAAVSTTVQALVSSTTTTVLTRHLGELERIVIPVLGVDAEIMRVGLKSNGDMQVPRFGYAGWFEFGPVPGAVGPSVIVGHVDTRRKPDIFYRLDELRPGDEFYVLDAAGKSATFTVDYLETVLKTELPTERIWAVSDNSLIRLITCGGDWDSTSRHYLSNVIVYGHLVR